MKTRRVNKEILKEVLDIRAKYQNQALINKYAKRSDSSVVVAIPDNALPDVDILLNFYRSIKNDLEWTQAEGYRVVEDANVK